MKHFTKHSNIKANKLQLNKALELKSTPYFEVHNAIPDVSHLRTFGCDAYVTIPDSLRNSYGVKADKGIFVGYDDNSLAYKVYMPDKRSIIKSGHVVFNEDLSSRVEPAVDIDDQLSPEEHDNRYFQLLRDGTLPEIAPVAPEIVPSQPTSQQIEQVTQPSSSSSSSS